MPILLTVMPIRPLTLPILAQWPLPARCWDLCTEKNFLSGEKVTGNDEVWEGQWNVLGNPTVGAQALTCLGEEQSRAGQIHCCLCKSGSRTASGPDRCKWNRGGAWRALEGEVSWLPLATVPGQEDGPGQKGEQDRLMSLEPLIPYHVVLSLPSM